MSIQIQGAREHNLRDIDVEIGDGLTVVTGVSGSGKTSLVFDTLYHEARRRFLEVYSLGSVAERLSPANVDRIEGLGPAVAVGQNLLNRNPNSTLATASGLHPFLRLLFARFGERACSNCGTTLSILTEDEIVDRLTTLSRQGDFEIVSPLVSGAQGSHRTLLKLLAQEFGPESIRVDKQTLVGHEQKSEQVWSLDPDKPHDIEVILASIEEEISTALARDFMKTAAAMGATALKVVTGNEELILSRSAICPSCSLPYQPLEPIQFRSKCPDCEGAGCSLCTGTGLHPEAVAVRWHGSRFPELLAKSVAQAKEVFNSVELPAPANRLASEINRRLGNLDAVGLGYVTLDRPSPTLSRGEAQRLRLAVILTSELEDMLHVLDEPTIGQHPADVTKLLPIFRQLRGPVVFVEHDRAAAAVSDQALDLGPGAGSQGGHLLYSGAPAGLWGEDSPTGRFFSHRQRVSIPEVRPGSDGFIMIRGAILHNLKDIDIRLPLGKLTVVSGVSGSGKSTLVEEVLVKSLGDGGPHGCADISAPALKTLLVDQNPIGRNPRSNPATYTKLSDVIRDLFSDVTGLSASHFSFNRPEGACPTCKGMGALEVKMRYLPSAWIPCVDCDEQRFSEEILNARIDFGTGRYSIAEFYELSVAEALSILSLQNKLSDRGRRKATRILKALVDVGLDYLPLGQPSPTLSGGEAQRVKLAEVLGQGSLSQRLLVLDEPTTGLHPQDVVGLLFVLDRLVRSGSTIVVVEHNLDVIRAADWVIDLGPGSGPNGGRLLYSGPVQGLSEAKRSLTGKALQEEGAITPKLANRDGGNSRSSSISIRKARVHNLQGVDVDFPKGELSVVTGVSGSGKSSLVNDVLVNEARRRFLESLSMYERQSIREGPESVVDEVNGLGVAIAVESERRLLDQRATVGTATEISHHLEFVMASLGECLCSDCGRRMNRSSTSSGSRWLCSSCGHEFFAEPRHFNPNTYAAACTHCNGVGTLQVPNPDKLIIHPEKPLCAGAMYSPGFFPKGYLCKPTNNGYDMVQAIAVRHGFDPATTPWNEMTTAAQQAFLFGDSEPIEVTFQSRTKTSIRTVTYPGFYGFIRDWDVGGTYTDTRDCPECLGARLRPEYLAVTLSGYNMPALREMPLSELASVLQQVDDETMAGTVSGRLAVSSIQTMGTRLQFLIRVGLSYLHLNRPAASLSAGEAQRIKLAALLGGGLRGITVLLDEPTRGLHPAEVDALKEALLELRDQGNTVIVVEHDFQIVNAADYLIDLGPGSGISGGLIVASGTPDEVNRADTLTGSWLRGDSQIEVNQSRRQGKQWLTIQEPRANNLQGEDLRIPYSVLVGVCGVSGSGKSTLMIDTLGRALAPKKYTTSVAQEPIEPGAHEGIDGSPARTILVDQSRAGVVSPASYLGLDLPLRRLFAASESALALGITEIDLARRCSACNGRGLIKIDLSFLPAVRIPCEICHGTGYRAEAWTIHLRDVNLPDLYSMTIDQVFEKFGDEQQIGRLLLSARDVGLGYLVLRQPGHTLSGGEAQRLKIARELKRKIPANTLYILDEPTVGQHLEDVRRLISVLDRLVDAGHTVVVIEHHPHILASCDWLIELGPGGGPAGGRIVAEGTPEDMAAGNTATAPYLREVLEA